MLFVLYMTVDVKGTDHPNMEPDGVDDPEAAAAPSADGRYHGVMVYLLVPCVYDWICKPGTEHRQSVELRPGRTNQHRDTHAHTSREEVEQNRRGPHRNRGHKASLQGFTICLRPLQSTRTSLGFGDGVSVGAACRSGYDLRLKHCGSNGGANLNAVDKRAGRNLHFILIILFSTNKLTPEKT